MSIVKELNGLAEKMTGENPNKKTINEALDFIADYLTNNNNNEKVISKNIKIIADNYQTGGGGGADISEYLDNVIEPIPDAYSEAIYGKAQPLLKKLPDNLTLGEGIDDLYSAFENLSGLVSIPLFDTSNVVNMGQMFIYCSSLVDIPQFNTSNVFSLSNAFVGCVSLSNESLNNILAMCINATNSYDGEKKLESIGLSAEQITICHGLSNYQAFLNAGWTDGD